MNDELNNLERVSDWYVSEQVDFDKRLIEFRYRTWKQRLVGPKGLELGPAEGVMTKFLLDDFESLTVVDAASNLLNRIPDADNLVKIHSLFEDFDPEEKFNSIIMEHILEHVDDPTMLLKRAKDWLLPGGKLYLGVPNGNSFHRLVAVKMGLLGNQCQLNNRDIKQGHRRVYTHETFRNDVEASDLHIIEMGGVFFKPLSNSQIDTAWTNEMIEGFYQLGKDFPQYAADIFCVCSN